MTWLANIGSVSFLLGALVSGLAALWIARSGAAERSDRWAAVAALALTANWCFAAASFGAEQPIVALTEVAKNLAWIYVLLRLFANDGRDETLRLVRPAAIVLALVESFQIVLVMLALRNANAPGAATLIFETSAILRALTVVGALVLLHNLYVGAALSSRRILRWNAAALAGMWAFSLNFYTLSYLTGEIPVELQAIRGLAAAIIAVPFAVGFNSNAAGLEFRPSRTLTFRSLSLLVIGAYFILMLLLANSLDMLRGDIRALTQVGLILAAGALALIWLPSQRVRGWLRVTAVKHLFKHRYDYRNEWIRFTNTIGRSGFDETTLQERAIKALADITDSPCGLLLLPEDDGALALGAQWNWPTADLPSSAMNSDLAAILEREALIIDFDEVRAGKEHHGELAHMPDWPFEELRVWAAVPLLHFDRLVGVVILARPAIERELDWEDFDLLGIVGRQLASYLAEQSGQAALSEASRFDEFNRRMAFVMHDIKNLSSQMSLLLRNAEKHADKPEFRKDMLVTLKNSADKLNLLLARLGRYGTGAREEMQHFDLAEISREVAARFEGSHPVRLARCEAVEVVGDREGLEQALVHLVQNAIDASEADIPVMIETFSNGISGQCQVIDNGKGMSPAFVRNGLFKPFVSSKEGGFGIGAYEAREIIRAMDGRLDVESREGLGTRFAVSLPLRSAKAIYSGPKDLIEETV
ncbi:XrtA/PEP-CTERM system histidine kinase PrsK [Qipengyuania nanhaisediminis]|uniref:histidine kinase n=1 Tax=Qipengyuania nanhaisediminis TaxID=604088 RepID=A0A1I5N0U5_9SPHN|nr:XrtA/PEP-CTERM system histidine kinase PrsK [Qipengyuania nanhaisediminis]SFP15413.1 putative PEP-CTERM system histidine kinase [Qipengyuania nanhaisediminis]